MYALRTQAFIGYSPIEEGGDNEITLHYTLSCDLSGLLGSTGVGDTGSNTKVRKFSRIPHFHTSSPRRGEDAVTPTTNQTNHPGI